MMGKFEIRLKVSSEELAEVLASVRERAEVLCVNPIKEFPELMMLPLEDREFVNGKMSAPALGIAVFKKAGGVLSVVEFQKLLRSKGFAAGTAKGTLARLIERGLVVRGGRGLYKLVREK
jgi:hypothetical protein